LRRLESIFTLIGGMGVLTFFHLVKILDNTLAGVKPQYS
jgi:hypothetical protein